MLGIDKLGVTGSSPVPPIETRMVDGIPLNRPGLPVVRVSCEHAVLPLVHPPVVQVAVWGAVERELLTTSLSIPGVEYVGPVDTHGTALMRGFPQGASVLIGVRRCLNARRLLDPSERDLGR